VKKIWWDDPLIPAFSPGEKENRFQRLEKDERMVRGCVFVLWLSDFGFLKLISKMIFSQFGKKRYSPEE
jgi:hypothetical protein